MPEGQPLGNGDAGEGVLQFLQLRPADPLLDPREEPVVDVLLDTFQGAVVIEIVEGNVAGPAEGLQQPSQADERQIGRDATSLQRLSLESMKGITDLRPVADAPALRELLLIEIALAEPDSSLVMVRRYPEPS